MNTVRNFGLAVGVAQQTLEETMTRMNRVPAAVVTLAAVLFTMPLFAAGQKRRAVVHPTNVVSDTIVKGTVVDDATGQPVKSVDVTSGNTKSTTGADGRFQLALKSGPTLDLRFSRSGYVTKDLTLAKGSDTTVRLTSSPTVRVRMTDGTTYVVDTESVQWAFAATMSEYPRTDYPRMCRNGQEFQPARETIAKITGPATPVDDSACCDRGNPVLRVNMTLKSGLTVDARFVDNCYGYDPLFVGRDHVSGDFRYLRFVEVAEITFP